MGILAGVAGIVYLLNQRERENNFEQNNQLPLQHFLQHRPYQQELARNPDFGYANSCANSYPLYTPDYIKHQQQVLSGLPPTKKADRNKIENKFEKDKHGHLNNQ